MTKTVEMMIDDVDIGYDDEDCGDDDEDCGDDDEDCGDDDEDCGDDDEDGADEDVDSGYDDDDGFCSNRSFLRYNALIVNSHPDPGTGHLLSPMPLQCHSAAATVTNDHSSY